MQSAFRKISRRNALSAVSMVGAIFGGTGLAWAFLELVLGPTAKTRIRTTGATVDLPLVKRARRARRVLAKIDAAVRADRGGLVDQQTAPITGPPRAESPGQTSPETASATAPVEDLTSTNGS